MKTIELTDEQYEMLTEVYNNSILEIADMYDSKLIDEVFLILNPNGSLKQ